MNHPCKHSARHIDSTPKSFANCDATERCTCHYIFHLPFRYVYAPFEHSLLSRYCIRFWIMFPKLLREMPLLSLYCPVRYSYRKKLKSANKEDKRLKMLRIQENFFQNNFIFITFYGIVRKYKSSCEKFTQYMYIYIKSRDSLSLILRDGVLYI